MPVILLLKQEDQEPLSFAQLLVYFILYSHRCLRLLQGAVRAGSARVFHGEPWAGRFSLLLWCSCRNPTGPGTTPVEQPVPLFREAANPVHMWGRGSQEALLPLATPL